MPSPTVVRSSALYWFTGSGMRNGERPFPWIVWIHILSPTLLFGAGIGTAFHMFASRLWGSFGDCQHVTQRRHRRPAVCCPGGRRPADTRPRFRRDGQVRFAGKPAVRDLRAVLPGGGLLDPGGRASVPDPAIAVAAVPKKRRVAHCLHCREAQMVPLRMTCACFADDFLCPDGLHAIALVAFRSRQERSRWADMID